ncbi:MAG: hypothetical protein ACKOJF_16470 [Planctomycetaceae bacterium]
MTHHVDRQVTCNIFHMSDTPSDPRLFWRLRIDCEGCHQLWLPDRLTVGSAAATVLPDLPIRGPLSRRHLTLHRGAEGWWAEAHAPVKQSGRATADRFDLGARESLWLGDVGLRIERPSPISSTATLQVQEPHRHAHGFDRVILLHDLCLLGPGRTPHIPCASWSVPLVLFRRGDELHIQGRPDLELNGIPAPEGGRLTQATTVLGPGLRMHLEPA